jgi:hypothetical protein
MGRPSKKAKPEVGGVTPQHEHATKIIKEDAERKAQPKEIESVTYRAVSSEGTGPGKVKYQKETRLSNGTKWRTAVSREEYEANANA